MTIPSRHADEARTDEPPAPWSIEEPGGWFGRWELDDHGSPSFVVDPSVDERALVTPAHGVAGTWHQVGNAGITALAHAGGWSSLWVANRGMVRLTDRRSWWGLRGHTTTDVVARWLPGGVEWTARCGPATVRRRMVAHPDGLPLLRVDVEVTGARGETWEERWVPEPLPLLVGGLMSGAEPPPPGLTPTQRATWRAMFGAASVSRRLTWSARRRVAPFLQRTPRWLAGDGGMDVPARWPLRDRPATSPAWIDLALPDLFVVPLDWPALAHRHWDGRAALLTDIPAEDPHRTVASPSAGWHVGEEPAVADTALAAALTGGVEVAVNDDEALHLSYVVGVSVDDTDRRRLITAAVALGRDRTLFDRPHQVTPTDAETRHVDHHLVMASPWPSPLHLALDDPDAAWLPREASWHATALQGAAQHDDHFGARYVSQGSAYAFAHGLQGAPRDYALFAAALSYVDPRLAGEQLEVALRMMTGSGSVLYAHTGRGMGTSGGIHAAPTDLPLWVAWAVTDHVWVTGDHSFLDRVLPFFPSTAGEAASVREHVARTLRYLLDRVGTGPHGLVRVGSGDWADPISAMVRNREAFHRHGESTFNTGFACYVLPRAATLLDASHPDLADELRATAATLRTALDQAWTGRWWLRGFDGEGGAIGADHLFVDGQVWPIIAGAGTDAARRRVVDEIAARCDDPSPIGATILDRPHPVHLGMLAPGWDCNGGVWAAINGLLAWAYATVDPALAWRGVAKQSFAAHASAHPEIWYGIWSGPDAYNAWFGSRPGETFVQPATPMRDFPVMNANADAGPLLGLFRTLGLEATPDGVVVADRAAAGPAWSLTTAAGRSWSSPT